MAERRAREPHPLSVSSGPLRPAILSRRRSSAHPAPPENSFDSPLLLRYEFPLEETPLGKHVGEGTGRRVFIGPRVETSGTRAGRSGSQSSVSRTDAIEDCADNEYASGSGDEEGAHRSRRLRRALRNVSFQETIPPKAGLLRSWKGGSFEIGGDVREAAKRDTARLEMSSQQAEMDRTPTNRRRADTFGGSTYRTATTHLERPALGNRTRAGTTSTFRTAHSHLDEPSRPGGEYRPASPPPAVEEAEPALLHDLLRRPSDPRLSSTVSLLLPTPSDPFLSPLATPVKLRSALRSASESFPLNSRPPGMPGSPSKSILRSASESYPNNTRPFVPFQSSKLGREVKREPSTHFGDEPAPSAKEVLARPDEALGMLVEEPEAVIEPAPPKKCDDVLRKERMLLRAEWSAREDLPDSFDENTARKYPTQRSSWEEAAVVWRRGQIEIYTEFSFPVVSLINGNKKLRHVIPLTPNRTRLSVYSSPDLIFCLTHRPAGTSLLDTLSPFSKPDAEKKARKRGYIHYRKSGTNIFILRPRTLTIAKEWIWLLYRELGGSVPPSLDISVPGLGATIKIPIPADLPSSRPGLAIFQGNRAEKGIEAPLTGEGYRILKSSTVVKACVEQLVNVPEWTQLLRDAKSRGVEMRLAWRRGQVLDWVADGAGAADWSVLAGHAIRQPHLETVLELRAALHYPTVVHFPTAPAKPVAIYSEPPSIEGYLYRKRAKGGSERVYLSSHSGHLFLSSPSKAHPPDPPVPLVVAIDNPAALILAPFAQGRLLPPAKKADPSQPSKLARMFGKKAVAGQRPVEFKRVQEEAPVAKMEREERHRAELQIMAAQGYVDFRDIVEVTIANEGSEDSSFEIALKSSQTVRFECYSNPVAAEWVGRLSALIKYWTRRQGMDTSEKMELGPVDQPTQSRRPRPGEAIPPHEAVCPDLEASSSPRLTNMYNRCVVEGCRGINRSARFFVKDGLRGMFKDRYCLLVGSHLLEYEVKRRDIYGAAVQTVYHHRRHTISLRDCYVYSGGLAFSVLGPDSSGTHWNPADYKQQHFARLYDDGLMSSDTYEDCSFVIWKKERASQGLGQNSSVRVFRARTKVERNEWIFALNAAIERLHRGDKESQREERLREFAWLQ